MPPSRRVRLIPPAWADAGFPSRRWVKIVFVNTGERFNNLYFSDGAYIMPAVQQFLMDLPRLPRRRMEVDPPLADGSRLRAALEIQQGTKINILSGYRTPRTNAQLEGRALNSQHMRAMALISTFRTLTTRRWLATSRRSSTAHWDVSGPRLHPFRFWSVAQLGQLISELWGSVRGRARGRPYAIFSDGECLSSALQTPRTGVVKNKSMRYRHADRWA